MTQKWLKGLNSRRKYTFVPGIGVVKTTPMDRALGRSVNISSKDVRRDFSDGQKEFSNLPVFRDLLADTFYTYYLNEPIPIDSEKLPAEYRISQLLLTWMTMQPDTSMAKSMTTSSAPASIAASLFSWRAMMSDEAFEAIRKAMEQLANMKGEIENERNKEYKEQSDSGEQQQGKSDESDEQDKQDQQGEQEQEEQSQPQASSGDEEQDEQEQPQPQPQPQSKADELQKEYERKAEKVEQAIQNMMGNPVTNGAMRDATKDSLKKIEDLSAMAKGWGMELGQMSVVDIAAIMRLYEDNEEFISKLASLIGRSEIASSSALQRVRESYIGNPTKINLTQDISHVLPYEAILLSDMSPRVLRTQQVLDWASQGLPGWVVEAEGMTQGSFVAYVDGSGSMTYNDNEREVAAKAVAFGLAKTLHDDRFEQRAYVIKTFGAGQEEGFIAIDENSKMDEIAKWSGEMFGYGTNFNYCFEDCLKVMDDLDKRDILGTDLVFITDGEAKLKAHHREEWIEFSKRTGSRLMLVLITDRERIYDPELEKMADLVIRVNPYKFSNDPESVIEQLVNIVAMPRKEENGL